MQKQAGLLGGKELVSFSCCMLVYWYVIAIGYVAKYVRGMYAVRVKGRIPEDVEAELESRGIKYRPRDQSDQDWAKYHMVYLIVCHRYQTSL